VPHALGATYKGRPVGTFGPVLSSAFKRSSRSTATAVALRCSRIPSSPLASAPSSDALPWPSEKRVRDRLLMGRLQRVFIKPWVFSISLFPVLWVSALIDANPDVFLWEEDPFARSAAGPVHGTLSECAGRIRPGGPGEARWLDRAGAGERPLYELGARRLPGIQVPDAPPDRTHVYYQYCVYGPEGPKRDELVVRCVRRGIDIETLHVDVPPDMPLFEGTPAEREGARRAAQAIQIPMHAGLTKPQLERVASTVRSVLAGC